MGGGSADNSNAGKGANKTAGKGDGKTAGKGDGKTAGKDANKDAVKSGKSGKSDKNADKNANKASKKDSKDDKKTKGKDRDADNAGKKLSLEDVKNLPACVAEINEDNTKVTIKSPSGEAKCAISANEKSGAFYAIREKIESLSAGDGEIDFVDGVKAYGYGSLSKDKEGLFSGANVFHIRNGKNFDVSNVTDMSYLFKDSSLAVDFFYVNFYDPTSLIGWDVSKVTNMEGMFEGCANLQNLKGMRDWDVSKVTNMKNMFKGCTGIEELDGLANWNVGSVTNMSNMFKGKGTKILGSEGNENKDEFLYGSDNLTDISALSSWANKVGKVTDMSGMFEGRTSLKSLKGLENWNISSVTNMSGMFNQCASDPDFVREVQKNSQEKGFDISALSSWVKTASKDSKARNVSNVTDMSNMFEGCTSLKSLKGLENWDVSNVRSMSGMFASVIKNQDQHDTLNPVDGYAGEMAIASVKPLSKWNVGNVINMNRMFEGCTSITDFTGLEGWDTKNVEEMIGMFEYCKSMSSLVFLEKWNVNNVKDMMVMFALCGNIESTEGLGKWNVSNVKKMDGMFAYCSNLKNIKGLDNWNTSNSSTSKLASTSRMFYNCVSLTSLYPLEKWNVSNVTDMSSMFNTCGSLTSLDPLKDWDVSSVEKMSDMFSNCGSLTSLQPLSSWNVGSVTDMSSMFSYCTNLSNLSGLEKWNVGSVENMSSMFNNCTNLSNLSGLEKWNVGNVKNMSSMFSNCYFEHTNKKGDVVVEITGLADISALSGWNVGSVTNMFSMFSGCTRLGNLKGLEGWNVSNVTNMFSMFSDCKKLTGVADLSKWDISKVTDLSSMFSNAGAESGDSLILDFSNKNFTKPTNSKSTTVSVDSMFSGFKGTLIANNLQSSGFENNTDDDPIKSNFATGEIFSFDENGYSDNIVVTNNVTILDTISNNEDLKNTAYYIPVKAKLMEPGDMGSCKCDGSGDSGGTTGGTTYNVPALYNSGTLERQKNEKSQDYAYRIVKNSFASKLRYAIDNNQKEDTGGEEDSNSGLRSARLKSRVKELQSARESQSVRDVDDEDENPDEVPEPEPEPEEQGSTYKIMFKKSSGSTCAWTELGEGEDGAAPDNPMSPVTFFTTMYYLETFVKPVPLPHTGGQSAVMFTFLSIGLFSIFAVSGAFGRHGWVASVLPSTALATFGKHTKQR
ncbi:BspA family leucine-rich repeat surface protein [Gardnerella sp. KA00255]|uniref:BspA family leucine-rich repeat surface protein n=1 Tax=Gardnerella sp. KA00255 TaxID=2749073 RepID=UPI003BA9F651